MQKRRKRLQPALRSLTMSAEQEPWFVAATGLLDVRRQDRLLAIGISLEQARGLAALVGKGGTLVAVIAATAVAEQLAALELPQVTVLAHAVQGDEPFGTFDAVLVESRTGPVLPLGSYANLLRTNLRPGGRFVLDLPGTEMVPDLAACWIELGWPPARLQCLRGLADDVLAETLRNAGLRSVHGVLGAHLVNAASPAELVAAFAAALELQPAEQLELAHALVRRRATTGPIETLVHRTRLQGQR